MKIEPLIPLRYCSKEERGEKEDKCQDHLHYGPRTRMLRIIITPLPGELIQFAKAKQNESMLI